MGHHCGQHRADVIDASVLSLCQRHEMARKAEIVIDFDQQRWQFDPAHVAREPVFQFLQLAFTRGIERKRGQAHFISIQIEPGPFSSEQIPGSGHRPHSSGK
jgi:hypothetical protein